MKIIIIGGGAGGMLAAGRAAECGAKVVLLERNNDLGRKLRITGKGRCNITNIAEREDFVSAFGAEGKFLYGALSRFSNQDLIDLLHRLGVPTKTERGGRVFPKSDRAADVVVALEKWLRELKVDIRTGVRAKGLQVEAISDASVAEPEASLPMPPSSATEMEDQSASTQGETRDVSPSPQPSPSRGEGVGPHITGVEVFGGVIRADAVILATGGITYPRTGSTGDGFRMAEEIGHTVIPPTPSLSALETKEPWVAQLQGLSLKNVTATLFAGGKKVAKEFGEMLFTHFGVSGPTILSLSKKYVRLEEKSDVRLSINLKPALTREQLDERLIADFVETRHFKNYLPDLLPKTLIPVFVQLSAIPESTPLNRITAPQRKRIIDLLTDFRLTITRARAADEAIVTAGGVSLKEVDPRTMESKLVKNLYFVGEVLDLDAVTGGYNLQEAFSTGWVAGENAAHCED